MKNTRPPASNKAMAPTPRNSLGSSSREAPVAVCVACPCPSGNFVKPSAVADASTTVAPAAGAGAADVVCASDEEGVVTEEVFVVAAG